MKSTIDALKSLYVKFGGSLNDAYEDIADGSTVADYVNIPDCIEAITKVADVIPSEKNLVASNDNGTVNVNLR